MKQRRPSSRTVAALGIVASLVAAPSASAQVEQIDTARLRAGVTVNGILQHERALMRIAAANGGNRSAGSAGYDASLAYVKQRLQRAGYRPVEQAFEFAYFEETVPPELARSAPTEKTYAPEADVTTMQYSGSGEVSARVVPIDVQVPPPAQPGSTSGCEAADFAGFTSGAIALVQRGTCTFEVKAANAQAAGAAAVIIFNEGQAGRTDAVGGTLGRPFTVPVLFASFAVGEELVTLARSGSEVTVRLKATTISEARTSKNLLADTARGDASQTVVVGGHLDSVPEGPGINDNGSGTASILETAEEMAELRINPRRKIRFAFWGAEELGLFGSEHYVEQLGPEGVADVYANLNFDMLGSPNYVRFVYDGDGSSGEGSGPPGSAEIEALFNRYYAERNLATEPTAFDGRSDYGPFIAAGIPAGGLFSGAEGIKTAEQAATYGGVAGEPYDACYHLACDTVSNLSARALSELSDGLAHATMTLARSRTGLFADGSRGRGLRVRAQTHRRSKAVR